VAAPLACPIPLVAPCTTFVKTLITAPGNRQLAGAAHPKTYGVHVTIDPAPFLSTLITASAALVAIIGGLLVARFVSLDTDQRTIRKVLADAAERLAVARSRAESAWQDVLWWEADKFFDSEAALKTVIDDGVTSADELVRIVNWRHEVADLAPFAAEVADEAKRAREALDGRVSDPYVRWIQFRDAHPDLPEIHWPQAWEHVYDGITNELIEAEKARLKAAPHLPRPTSGFASGMFDSIASIAAVPPSDFRATAARRYDELLASHARATQRVEDYEAELGRLQLEQAEIVRPDARLWWGIGILVIFAILGVALPLWVMAEGPHDLVRVRWVFYPFAGSLAALIIYIVIYLVQLTRSKRD
jgi:hypothetical protein